MFKPVRVDYVSPLSALLIVTAMIVSCNDDESAPPRFLSDTFRIEGTASGTSGALTIDCLCDLLVEIDTVSTENDGTHVYRGVHGGEFVRNVMDSTGAGIEVVPVVFGDVIIYQSPQGLVDFEFPANNNTGIRFWDSLGHFSGSISGEELTGEWTCAPFEIPQDSAGTITGTWEMVPL